jgi:hypothetical protein
MKIRPTSITVISWILIVLGSISLITTSVMINNTTVRDMMAKSPIPISVQFAMTYVGVLILIICGIGMLKGRNWTRLLYVIWSVLSFVLGFATSPAKAAMLPGLVIFVIVVFFLFRPKATEFFTGAASENAQSN